MKKTTQSILDWFSLPHTQDSIYRLSIVDATYSIHETTIKEAIDLFNIIKEAIIRAIEANIFDEQLTYTKRLQIFNSLKGLTDSFNLLHRNYFDITKPESKSYYSPVIKGILSLKDIVESAKIYERLNGYSEFYTEIKKLSEIKRKYEQLVKAMTGATQINKDMKEKERELNETLKMFKDEILNVESETEKVKVVKAELGLLLEIVNKNNQEIEDKKVKIASFHNNIEEYQNSILKIETDAKNVVAKETKIDELISQAENALNLNSAYGISAAFSAHHDTTSKNNVLLSWMGGASVFIVIALALTIWIVSGKGIEHPDALSSIIGRVVAVIISITGATFCAKQYVKQKNIIEDYAYKSVLSKSIVAFTEEIKKRDATKVAEYLTKVLGEIHQDPLRNRNNNEDKNIGLENIELIKKIADLLPKKST